MAADIFQRELLATGAANDSTVGAALIALESVGGIDSVCDYQPDVIMTFTPETTRCGSMKADSELIWTYTLS